MRQAHSSSQSNEADGLITYVLKSRSGRSLLTFDDINRARDVQRERQAKAINLRLFKQTVTEEELGQ